MSEKVKITQEQADAIEKEGIRPDVFLLIHVRLKVVKL